jgi:hypothetical protein
MEETNQDKSPVRQPYDFGHATFLPFYTGRSFFFRFTLFYAVLNAVGGLISSLFMNSRIAEIEAEMTALPEDEFMQVFPLLGEMLVLMIPALIVGLVVFIGAEFALHKKVQLDIEDRPVPLRLGGIETRGFVAILVVFLLCFVAALIIATIFGVIGALIGGPILTVVLTYIGFLVPFIYLGIKLAAASALTTRDGQIRIFQSFKATKGRFWPMFGSYAVLTLMSCVALFCVIVIMMVSVGITGGEGGMLESLTAMNETTYWTSSVSRMISYVIMSFIVGLIMFPVYACWWGVGSYVARLHRGETSLADTFS